MGRHRCLGPILLLAAVRAPDAPGAPHQGGRTANPPALYDWARPRAVAVSRRMPTPGSTDPVTALERAGTPLLRTGQRGAVHFRGRSDRITTEGFVDQHEGPRFLTRPKETEMAVTEADARRLNPHLLHPRR
jgi:hypothetical protein